MPGTFPDLGFGVGLRTDHYDVVLEEKPEMGWFEVISENFMVRGGRPLAVLDAVRRDYPIVLHGVSLSIGSADPLREDYLDELAALVERVEPPWVSDHLCWTGVGGRNAHDLLPLPYTEEALEHVSSRIDRVQERIGRPFVLENVSSYLTWRASAMPEWEFLAEVVRRTGAYLLFDVNNVYVSSRNHGFDPLEYVDAIPRDRVVQFHLAGHQDHGEYCLDTHDHPVPDPVWDLYRHAVRRFGPVATLIERDDRIPPFSELAAEAARAKRIREEELAHASPRNPDDFLAAPGRA